MSSWRAAGLTANDSRLCTLLHNKNYIQYSNIAARIVRRSLKAEFKTEAAKREEVNVKFTPWKDGRPAKAPQRQEASSS